MDEESTMGFTDAPAEATWRVFFDLGGTVFNVGLTIRDSDPAALLGRVGDALQWCVNNGHAPAFGYMGPVGAKAQQSAQQSVPVQPNQSFPQQQAPNNGQVPVCPQHGKPMLPSRYANGGYYCSQQVGQDPNTGRPMYCDQKVQ